MEALQRPISSVYRANNESGEDEADDSFFELEPTSGDLILYPKTTIVGSSTTTQLTDKPKGGAFPSSGTVQCTTSNTPKFNLPQSKRKILPIESSFSTPKFRDLMFNKSKPVSEAGRTEEAELRRHKGRSFFTIKFKCRETDRKNGAAPAASCSDGTSNSKRFSKETIHKYLRLVKPLYAKVSSKRQCRDGTGEFSLSAGRFRVVACSCKQLGKSKSASGWATGVASPARRDDSLLQQQHDGIESAILHCKRSFSSSRSSCDRVSIS